MAVPPTLVSEYEVSSWTTTATPKTVSVTVSAGDTLAVVGLTGDFDSDITTPTGGGLTYTLQTVVEGFNTPVAFSNAYIWTATSSTSQTFTLSAGRTTGGSWGFNVLRYSGVSTVGAAANAHVDGGAPALNITTINDNSAIVVGNADWDEISGTTRTWRAVNGASPTEQTYVLATNWSTFYAAQYTDAGTAGVKTVGLSAPTGQRYSIVAVELVGSASVAPSANTSAFFSLL